MTRPYATEQPDRADVDAMAGPVVVDFGTNWCGFCKAAAPAIAAALAKHPGVRHIKVEDGSGRALGRSFKVKLWPTLVLMRDGQEVARLVRPQDSEAVEQALARIQGGE
ncbi:MAG: thioredoxin family protein [Burkholderiales bacterium]